MDLLIVIYMFWYQLLLQCNFLGINTNKWEEDKSSFKCSKRYILRWWIVLHKLACQGWWRVWETLFTQGSLVFFREVLFLPFGTVDASKCFSSFYYHLQLAWYVEVLAGVWLIVSICQTLQGVCAQKKTACCVMCFWETSHLFLRINHNHCYSVEEHFGIRLRERSR